MGGGGVSDKHFLLTFLVSAQKGLLFFIFLHKNRHFLLLLLFFWHQTFLVRPNKNNMCV